MNKSYRYLHSRTVCSKNICQMQLSRLVTIVLVDHGAGCVYFAPSEACRRLLSFGCFRLLVNVVV